MSNVAHDKTLVLMRHGDAVDGLGAADHDRQLSPRGQQDARAAGQWLRDHELVPELVLCSTAVRARETWSAVESGGLTKEFIEFRKDVYQGGAESVLQCIREDSGDMDVVMVVGHNPTIMELASRLCDGRGSDPAHEALARGFRPAGVAVLCFSGAWERLGDGTCDLDRFHTPPQHEAAASG